MKTLGLILTVGLFISISAQAEYLQPGKIAQFKNLVQEPTYQAYVFITYGRSSKTQGVRCGNASKEVDKKAILLNIDKDGQVFLDKPFGGDAKWSQDECWTVNVGVKNSDDTNNDLPILDRYLTNSSFYYGKYVSTSASTLESHSLAAVKKFLNANFTLVISPKIEMTLNKTSQGVPFPQTFFTYSPVAIYGSKAHNFEWEPSANNSYVLPEKDFNASVSYDRLLLSLPSSVKMVEFGAWTTVYTETKPSKPSRHCTDLKTQKFILENPLPEALSFDLSLDCIPQ